MLAIVPLLGLALADLAWLLAGRRRKPTRDTQPSTHAASIVIPNWNGRDLLAKYLPHVLAATAGNPDNEVIVVENGSTDDSAQLLREQLPNVPVVPLEENLRLGGGSNAGFLPAQNEHVGLQSHHLPPQ